VPIIQIETSPKAYRLWTNGQTGSQYFLVENRQKTLFDRYLVEEGLLIYHVDESVSGNTHEWCPGSPPSPHYKVALEQSEGRFNLEGCYGYPTNSGDRGDPFPGYYGKLVFDSTTTPGSRNYSNNSTQVTVRYISYSDSVMYADLYVTIPYIRGDANRDGTVDLGDIVYLISYLYKSGPAPQPLLAGDANSDGVVNLGDVVYLISYLYKGGPPPVR
jgi:immune inhibitor A